MGRIRLTSHWQVHSIKKLVCDGISGICTGATTKIQYLEWYIAVAKKVIIDVIR